MGLNCCDATMEVKIGNCGVLRRGSHRGLENGGGAKRHFKPPLNVMSYKSGCRRRDGIDGLVVYGNPGCPDRFSALTETSVRVEKQ